MAEEERTSSTAAGDTRQEESTDEQHEEPIPCTEGGTEEEDEEAEWEESGEVTQAKKGPTPGIVYLSRIPPFMKPLKVRHLLSQHGEIGRVFLQPEDPLIHKRRKKSGGNKKKNYTEGWVEFANKRVAKMVAMMLNNRPIGGKKRSYYHDDLWNIKYLPKFRWTHLTEKIAYEQAVREQRIRTEVSQVKRENAFYLKNVEKSKTISAIIERKRRHAGEGGSKGPPPSSSPPTAKRSFKQRHVVLEEEGPSRPVNEGTGKGHSSAATVTDSLLNMIFTQSGSA